MKRLYVFILSLHFSGCLFALGAEVVNIGSRWELFVDHFLIEREDGVALKLHQPERREIVLEGRAEWEDNTLFGMRVLEDNGVVRLYYRAAMQGEGESRAIVHALAESHDGGLSFSRPELGLVEYNGSTANNILAIAQVPTVPPPFIDTNPDCDPQHRYKGLSGGWRICYAMSSPDGIHWEKMREEPIDMAGTFDTVNTAFWDARIGAYRSFTRYFEELGEDSEEVDLLGADNTHIRAIQSSQSTDFLNWSAVTHHQYADGEPFQMYTNATIPCPGAEHIYLAFPNRYVQHRIVDPEHGHPGVNDGMFMSSRDCVHWNRFPEAWVRPGLDTLNWTDRNNYPVWGIIQTSDTEWSMYVSEHYRHPVQLPRLRRLSIRPMGFVSLHAGYTGGEVLTRPFVFNGSRLLLNFSTSAAGCIRIEIQDAEGNPLDGYGMDDMAPLFGDALDGTADWNGQTDLSALRGQAIRLRIYLSDADLFALRFD